MSCFGQINRLQKHSSDQIRTKNIRGKICFMGSKFSRTRSSKCVAFVSHQISSEIYFWRRVHILEIFDISVIQQLPYLKHLAFAKQQQQRPLQQQVMVAGRWHIKLKQHKKSSSQLETANHAVHSSKTSCLYAD